MITVIITAIKPRFKQTSKWSKYWSEMSNQTKNSNLNYLIDPVFNRINRLVVFCFKNVYDRMLFQNFIHQP